MSATRAVALGDFAPAKPVRNSAVDSDGNVWALNLDQVESDTGLVLRKVRIPPNEVGASTHAFDTRHVLYSKLRPNLNKVVLPDEPGYATTELVPLLPDPKKCNRSYLTHYLRSSAFVSWAVGRTAGAKMPRLNMGELWAHEVPLPDDLDEQKRIAAILDKADAIRRKRRQAIKLADDFLRSVFLEMFGDPVTNRHGYALGTIRDLVADVRYGTSTKANTLGEGMPVLRMNNITYAGSWNFVDVKHVELETTEVEKYTVQPGDILFNRTNSKELVGKTAVYPEREPMAFAGYLVRARLNDRGNPYYVSAYLNSEHGKKTLVGMCKSIVGMANINAQEFQDIPILLPPKEVQDRFANRCRAVERSRSRHEKSALEAAALNAALSDRFFSK